MSLIMRKLTIYPVWHTKGIFKDFLDTQYGHKGNVNTNINPVFFLGFEAVKQMN